MALPKDEPNESNVIDSDEDASKSISSKKRHQVQLTIPTAELKKIKSDFNIKNDNEATILYNLMKKRPDLLGAMNRYQKKRRKSNPDTSTKGGVYIPPGVEEMIDATSDVASHLLKEGVTDMQLKARAYEDEKMAPPPPKSESPVEEIMTEHLKEALQTDKKVKEKALKRILGEDEGKKDIKSIISRTIDEKLPKIVEKKKTPDEELLSDIKKEIHGEIIKKLKGEGVQITPELVGQIINGVSSIVEKFEPMMDSFNIKANTQATQTKLTTIAELHKIIQEQNVRSFRDMIYLVKENEELLKHPAIKTFMDTMSSSSNLTMDLIKAELKETVSSDVSKRTKPIDPSDI